MSGGGGVVNQLTEVLEQHQLGKWVVDKGYECLTPGESGAWGVWVQCGWFGERHDHPAHVAAAVQESLNLTEEWGFQIDSEDPDEPEAWFDAADYDISRPVSHTRFVTKWRPSQSGETA